MQMALADLFRLGGILNSIILEYHMIHFQLVFQDGLSLDLLEPHKAQVLFQVLLIIL